MELGVLYFAKSLVLSIAEAGKMIERPLQNNVLFTMASKFRYCDAL